MNSIESLFRKVKDKKTPFTLLTLGLVKILTGCAPGQEQAPIPSGALQAATTETKLNPTATAVAPTNQAENNLVAEQMGTPILSHRLPETGAMWAVVPTEIDTMPISTLIAQENESENQTITITSASQETESPETTLKLIYSKDGMLGIEINGITYSATVQGTEENFVVGVQISEEEIGGKRMLPLLVVDQRIGELAGQKLDQTDLETITEDEVALLSSYLLLTQSGIKVVADTLTPEQANLVQKLMRSAKAAPNVAITESTNITAETPAPTLAPTETPVPTPEIAAIDNLALAQAINPATVSLDNGIGLNSSGHIVSKFNYETQKWEKVAPTNYEETLMAISHPIPFYDAEGNVINNDQLQFYVTNNVPATHPIYGWRISENILYPELADSTLPIGEEGDLVDRTFLHAYKQFWTMARDQWNESHPDQMIADENYFPLFAFDIKTNLPIGFDTETNEFTSGPLMVNMNNVKIKIIFDVGGGTQLSLPTDLAEGQNNQTGIGYLDLPYKKGTTGAESKSGAYINPSTFKNEPVIYYVLRTDDERVNSLSTIYDGVTSTPPMNFSLFPQEVQQQVFSMPGKVNCADVASTYLDPELYTRFQELVNMVGAYAEPIQDGREW